MRKTIAAILLILAMTAGLFCATACAETEKAEAETYRILLFSEPQSIKLPKATTSYWFQVPE